MARSPANQQNKNTMREGVVVSGGGRWWCSHRRSIRAQHPKPTYFSSACPLLNTLGPNCSLPHFTVLTLYPYNPHSPPFSSIHPCYIHLPHPSFKKKMNIINWWGIFYCQWLQTPWTASYDLMILFINYIHLPLSNESIYII